MSNYILCLVKKIIIINAPFQFCPHLASLQHVSAERPPVEWVLRKNGGGDGQRWTGEGRRQGGAGRGPGEQAGGSGEPVD